MSTNGVNGHAVSEWIKRRREMILAGSRPTTLYLWRLQEYDGREWRDRPGDELITTGWKKNLLNRACLARFRWVAVSEWPMPELAYRMKEEPMARARRREERR
jgi:hypothetical protein